MIFAVNFTVECPAALRSAGFRINAAERRERGANAALEVHDAPPLLVEHLIRVWPTAGCDAPHILFAEAARRILPPLVRPLEQRAAQAHAVRGGAARRVGEDLARQGGHRLGLTVWIVALHVRVVGVRAVFREEHRRRAALAPTLEQIAKADA